MPHAACRVPHAYRMPPRAACARRALHAAGRMAFMAHGRMARPRAARSSMRHAGMACRMPHVARMP
eukprot:1173558-Pyramimonas_sp.AAC.1